MNGVGLVRRPEDRWILDFGLRSKRDAALYEAAYEHALKYVEPARLASRTPKNRERWWQYERPRPEMFAALVGFKRYLATPLVSKYRLFVWLPATVVPENVVIVIARDDDCTFGVLQSRFHEAWALALGTSLEDRPRYTPSTTFETFPFPDGLTPDIPAGQFVGDLRAEAIAVAAKHLDQLRCAWLNPAELVRTEPEVVVAYPDRLIPRDENAAQQLAKRTLTALYNERPTWLANAHAELDAAVAAAYGWPADIATEEALERLLDLNATRAR